MYCSVGGFPYLNRFFKQVTGKQLRCWQCWWFWWSFLLVTSTLSSTFGSHDDCSNKKTSMLEELRAYVIVKAYYDTEVLEWLKQNLVRGKNCVCWSNFFFVLRIMPCFFDQGILVDHSMVNIRWPWIYSTMEDRVSRNGCLRKAAALLHLWEGKSIKKQPLKNS